MRHPRPTRCKDRWRSREAPAGDFMGQIWTFPRNAPHQVEITADPDYPWPRVDDGPS
ncbi:hypothetical protein KGQ20_00205 [Catenulispora sp. NF23]|uniref:hypothetical protein n=1 Tax=Catenulispora pinistramenti TaxID=2705254 RepID=UPI001BAE4FAC|nr:hypothetical protein [Catenulispora pinistramenti]MBS2531187.1 hypothetical protein [Catenulispora pinistramenti]